MAGEVSVRCAFCRGKGVDPFGIMSYLSSCWVCRGKGTVSIRTPYVRCAFCRGTGVYHGAGVVALKEGLVSVGGTS